jgi:hypothetical protein
MVAAPGDGGVALKVETVGVGAQPAFVDLGLPQLKPGHGAITNVAWLRTRV